MNTEFQLSYNAAFQHTAVYVLQSTLGGPDHQTVKKLAKPVEFGDLPNAGGSPEPTLYLTHEELQTLFDAMWGQGYRPQGGTAQTVDAMKCHLEDMRRLVFKGTADERV